MACSSADQWWRKVNFPLWKGHGYVNLQVILQTDNQNNETACGKYTFKGQNWKVHKQAAKEIINHFEPLVPVFVRMWQWES
jgi:hypothetical protein